MLMPDNNQDQHEEPLHGPNLILDVENFGPIAEAKNIEFRPMTVFVGPSNTGKSYLAMLLHAILKATALETRESQYWRFGARRNNKKSIDEHAIVTEIANWKRRWDARVEASGQSELIEVPVRELSNDIQVKLCKISATIVNQLTASIRRSVREYFEVNRDNELVLRQDNSLEMPSVDLRIDSDRPNPNRSVKIYSDSDAYDIQTFNISERTYESLDWLGAEEGAELASWLLLEDLANSSVDQLVPNTASRYLPASRTGIMLSHATLTDRIIADASRISRDGAAFVPFHRIHAEFLRAINAVNRRPLSHRPSGRGALTIADYLESKLLEGTINVETESIGLPRFYYERDNMKYPLFLSSSMITEIAPLVLFLRYYMSDRDLLIVEEPEAHLHPAAQQKMAADLAYLVRKGIRVLVTTHSHYMVEAMGMFVCASGIDDEARVRSMGELMGADGDDSRRELYLNEDEVAIYGFGAHDGSGTMVRSVPFDERSYSYAPRDYSEALVDQFNRISRVINERIDADELAANA